MRGGHLDRQIVIQQAAESRDSFGEPVKTWSTFATVWASKLDIVGRERFAARQDLAEESTVFRIRWLAGVTAKMRIVHDGKTYGIQGLAELGRSEGIDITAVAVLP